MPVDRLLAADRKSSGHIEFDPPSRPERLVFRWDQRVRDTQRHDSQIAALPKDPAPQREGEKGTKQQHDPGNGHHRAQALGAKLSNAQRAAEAWTPAQSGAVQLGKRTIKKYQRTHNLGIAA